MMAPSPHAARRPFCLSHEGPELSRQGQRIQTTSVSHRTHAQWGTRPWDRRMQSAEPALSVELVARQAAVRIVVLPPWGSSQLVRPAASQLKTLFPSLLPAEDISRRIGFQRVRGVFCPRRCTAVTGAAETDAPAPSRGTPGLAARQRFSISIN